MIDFSLLTRVDKAIKQHAHDRISIFHQHSRSAQYFGGWRYIGGDAPIAYDLFVDGERIDIRVGVDDLEELMPQEESPLSCIRRTFDHGKYASKIVLWLAKLEDAHYQSSIAAANAGAEIVEMLYDTGEIDSVSQTKKDIVNYKHEKAIGKRILGIDDDDDEEDDDDD